MEQETTWVLNLIKYQTEASRREGDKLKETIDKYTVGEEELFGKMLASDMEKLTDKKQMSPFNSTSEDKYKEIDKNLKILPYNLDIWGIIVAESVYDLNTSSIFNAVRYNDSSDLIKATSDRSITSWINPRIDVDKPYDVISIIPNDTILTANFVIKVAGRRRFQIGDTFVLSRSVSQNLYAKVIDDGHSNNGDYYCKIDQKVIDHLDSIQSGWYSKPNWKMRAKDPITIIDGKNETTTGFVVTINANQYIKINYGTQEHIAILNEKLVEGDWHGIVVNIGNTWSQYNVYVWKPSPSDSLQKLQNIFYETISFTPEETNVEEYTVDRSYSYMTNIRFFNSTIEEERQIKELLSYFSQNADKALILDNCDLKFRAPYISAQR